MLEEGLIGADSTSSVSAIGWYFLGMRLLTRLSSASYYDTAPPTFNLFDTSSTKSKCFANHAKIVKTKPAKDLAQ